MLAVIRGNTRVSVFASNASGKCLLGSGHMAKSLIDGIIENTEALPKSGGHQPWSP